MDITEQIIKDAEKALDKQFAIFEDIAFFNQEKVLMAFQENGVALRHFSGSTGYSYEDEGKFVLSRVFASSFKAEKAIVSPLLASGTHTIATALFGVLRPRQSLLSITGMPYDTLVPVLLGEKNGSLKDFGVSFEAVDFSKAENALKKKPTVVFIQRSRGYTHREALSITDIEKAAGLVRKISPNSVILVDNCYGEFTEKKEPLEAGADLIMGSLIKNPGGGIAPTGGYIAGSEKLVSLVSSRLTAPGIGFDVGSYQSGYRDFFQGFFMAPHITLQALKGAMLFSSAFSLLGYETLPTLASKASDIICSINFSCEEKLKTFIKEIQAASPVDSFAQPVAAPMPGYSSSVIMAAGTFVQGASIELSADAPLREPFTAFLQGGLSYEHIRIALKRVLKKFV